MKNNSIYTTSSKILHWLIAFIVIFMLSFSFFLPYLPVQMYTIHKTLGLTVLFLMIYRMAWIFSYGRPALPLLTPRWEIIFSRCIQYSFYVLLIIMPLCGWILSMASNHIPSYFGIIPLALPGIHPNKLLEHAMDVTHKTLAWVLIVFLILHVAGALKHHFLNKDQVLRRMWFGS